MLLCSSPIDLIPDFIPILLPALIALTVKLIPTEVWDKNFVLAENIWKDGKPKK
ncbi:hypothetical protein [Acetivibrio straminisolvens]|uniref:Uncharacterized protein n=1 Tax=Acetivibrio straminisolvens JCM 21531 TaxID=1294263 RepID=W4VAL7_9FIRM|nr:hypothetical protein [Acetivibrio straminisolvens]GAE89799.1 hypothetical protein JCM21531_3362 [Acetivibrio straminisolvens JCM 21531]